MLVFGGFLAALVVGVVIFWFFLLLVGWLVWFFVCFGFFLYVFWDSLLNYSKTQLPEYFHWCLPGMQLTAEILLDAY